jgi:hypothetical protein
MSINSGFDDRVTIYLAIESVELTPSILTARLGVHSDREWVTGGVRGRTGKRWDHNGWVVETTVCSEGSGGRPASELLPIAMERFMSKVGPFAKMASSLGSSVQRYTVLSIVTEEVPGIEFSDSFLRLLADLGGTFQIDLNTQPISSAGVDAQEKTD